MKLSKNLNFSNKAKPDYQNQIYYRQDALAHVKVKGLEQNLLCVGI
jgi:hypothetical protein